MVFDVLQLSVAREVGGEGEEEEDVQSSHQAHRVSSQLDRDSQLALSD